MVPHCRIIGEPKLQFPDKAISFWGISFKNGLQIDLLGGGIGFDAPTDRRMKILLIVAAALLPITAVAQNSIVDSLDTSGSNRVSQPWGFSCSAAPEGVSAIRVNGILNAACYAGTDWAAKVATAIATLSAYGGTVFVPASLAGTASTILTVPSNVHVQFDAGVFKIANAITMSGGYNRISGVTGTTWLQFTEPTDGIVISDVSNPVSKYITIEHIVLMAGNPDAGTALKISAPTNAVTNVVTDDVQIAGTAAGLNGSGSGLGIWNTCIYLNNLNNGSFKDTFCFQQKNGIYAINSTKEVSFYNLQITGGNNTVRGVFEDSASGQQGQSLNFYGGSLKGKFSASIIYLKGRREATGSNYLNAYALTTEIIGGGQTDGAPIVNDGGNLSAYGGLDGDIVAKNTSGVAPNTGLFGGDFGSNVTTASTGNMRILDSRIISLTNNNVAGTWLQGVTTSSGGYIPDAIGGLGIDFQPTNERVQFSWYGNPAFRYNHRAYNGFDLPSGSCWSINDDTFFSRAAAGTYKVGTSCGGSDGTIQAGRLLAGTTPIQITNSEGYIQGITATLITTAATTDNVTVTGMTSLGHCFLTPTNSSAATNAATTYISAKITNQITVTHTAKASMTYDVACWPN